MPYMDHKKDARMIRREEQWKASLEEKKEKAERKKRREEFLDSVGKRGCEVETFMKSENVSCDTELSKLSDNGSINGSFLLPILKWGPNNQVIGFYEAMHMANALNRKLVLPPFFFHEGDLCHNKSDVLVQIVMRLEFQAEKTLLIEDKTNPYG